jgi:hypothetical protein
MLEKGAAQPLKEVVHDTNQGMIFFTLSDSVTGYGGLWERIHIFPAVQGTEMKHGLDTLMGLRLWVATLEPQRVLMSKVGASLIM